MLRSLFTLCTLSGVILLSGCKETKSEAWYKHILTKLMWFIRMPEGW